MSAITHQSAADLFGVRSEAKNARDRLLDKAIDLFYSYGFNSVGLDQIISETGVTKTTFYKHFESKEQLVLAAIEKRHEWETEAWERAVTKIAGDDPRGKLLAFFDVMDVWFNDPSFGGCIFINAAAEFPDPREPAHQAAALHKKKNREYFALLAKQAGAKEPEKFADLYTGVLEGTLIMRHVHGRNDAAKVMRSVIEKLMDEHMK